jgi:hypothetical protein
VSVCVCVWGGGGVRWGYFEMTADRNTQYLGLDLNLQQHLCENFKSRKYSIIQRRMESSIRVRRQRFRKDNTNLTDTTCLPRNSRRTLIQLFIYICIFTYPFVYLWVC